MKAYYCPPATSGLSPKSDQDEHASFGFSSAPVVDLAHKLPSALYLEFLARLRLGLGQSISASTLVYAMEASGDAAVLDLAMLEFALDSLSADPNLVVGCKISPYTIADAFIWSALIKRLERASDCAPSIVLEITRTALLDEVACAGVRLKAAKRLGCRVAVNDFGPKTLKLPALFGVKDVWDIIKLGKECFGDGGDDGRFVEALRPTFELATSLAPVVIAKGIETLDHLNAARSVGVRYGQGWYLPSSTPCGYVRLGSPTFTTIAKCLEGAPFLSCAVVRQASA